MSIKIMSEVWGCSRAEGTDRLVMLALADFCDDEGRCYPGVARIAAKCRISNRTAQRSFKYLQAIGELIVSEHAGLMTKGGKTNQFFLVLKGGDKLTGGDIRGQKVVTNGAKGGDIAVSHKPSGKPSGKPSVIIDDDLFIHQNQERSNVLTSERIKKPRKGSGKCSQKEMETFCAEIGALKSDGEYMFLKFEADGWPKNWQMKIRQWNSVGYLPSQKQKSLHRGEVQTPSPKIYANSRQLREAM